MPANESNPVLVEVCAGCLSDVIVAHQCGANRIELNQALPLGGLTPSLGLLQAALEQTDLPIIVMIRPRESGFCYSDQEFDTLRRDIDILVTAGAAGIAIGLLQENGQVDVDRCRQIRQQIGKHELVFHRAFDFISDSKSALSTMVELGVDRVMTSGQANSALEGIDQIAQTVAAAAGRIEVLPAAGINSRNVLGLVEATSVNQVHGSFSAIKLDKTATLGSDLANSATDPAEFRQTDPTELGTAIQALKQAANPN